MSNKLCKVLNVDTKKRFYIFIGALLHDFGKFKLDKVILNKPDELTAGEFEIIKTHTDIDFRLIRNQVIKNIILYHHENIDGTGYKNLINIPYEAKIVRICDMFVALTSKRVYHNKISELEAIIVMTKEMKNFDRYIFNQFVKLVIKDDKSYNPSYNSYLRNSLKDTQ